MKTYIEQASQNTRLQEGTQVIEQLLLECYLNPGISTKGLARKTLLPTPVTAAIKRELIKAGALVQDRGVRCTADGLAWIEREWGYGGLDHSLYYDLLDETTWIESLKDILVILEELFALRPSVDVQIDQSKCTPETSLRRAILCLKQHALIGKKILCVGDDDLVSVSIGLLLQRLFPDGGHTVTHVDVLDIDERFLRYIETIAKERGLPIGCHQLDLREPLPENLHGQFDCFFTDPPYTLQGMGLFVSRGIQALKREKGLPIFLSFAHKSPSFMLAMQREFVRMGLTVSANFPQFNAYEGAEMIANRSQMFILRRTDQTKPEYSETFTDALYTGEVKQTLRTYRCKQCSREVYVGIHGEFATIEQLKNEGCTGCGNDTFDMVAKKQVSQERNDKDDHTAG
ncbi:putative methyltransferase [Paenibacillus chitinolyticus]|uniref:Bis-aminopropyl spermidine synthase family protein n=1 Tax=Paenibacillus chitinolyticus TaxID=79263 RepID=A0A410WYM4_9BACL|nr:bis-aminopropyl spermidine synthase family protein [Paenibacillus chitinolyticus]MCY9589930.1 bis-aminopropyl spermidine synthase family protein [Paenibacillus chitinolyticus]MCY9596267.1 bis-aminopropyl spermidine synthase family protein [Paenibacillus chitinolyticus]QAV19301.1 putative methyltransferase [Paenibacillus chitinolyticus]